MFVAREKEIERINNFLTKPGALIMYGLRRVGKTTLIKKVMEDSKRKYIYFECQKTNEETNVKLFVELLKTSSDFVDAEFTSFLSVFKQLDKQYQNYVFVIDEYSILKQYYLESKKVETKEYAEKIDSEFQVILDNYLNNNNLILSGSSINIMEKLLEHENPLYGRFDEKISLKQFSYMDAKKMFPDTSNDDFIGYYSVFGGSPYVLEKLNPKQSLKENIKELLLNEDGKLRAHLNSNVINELESDVELHDILSVIKNGSKKYKEIADQSHITTAGLLDKKLKKLIELDIIEAKFLIGREDDKRKKYYVIKDNLLRFYYSYIFRQDNRINLLGEERFYEISINPSIKEFISRRFENIVRDYFSLAVKKGLYPDIIDIGSYFSNDCEYDCVLKNKDNTYDIYEAKYYSKPMKKTEMSKKITQINEIKGLKINKVGFVCNKGFEEKIDNCNYIDINNLFFVK